MTKRSLFRKRVVEVPVPAAPAWPAGKIRFEGAHGASTSGAPIEAGITLDGKIVAMNGLPLRPTPGQERYAVGSLKDFARSHGLAAE